jgi:transposase
LAEFRQRIVELVRKGRTPEELARQFELSAQATRNWVKQTAWTPASAPTG